MRRFALSLIPLAALATMTPATSSAATFPSSLYQHGSLAQHRFTTNDQCTSARSQDATLAQEYGATDILQGWCHPYSITTATGTTTTGYVFDMTYRRTAPLWYGDANLGLNPTANMGAHSFRAPRSGYPTFAAAQSAQTSMVTTMKANPKVAVTWVAPPVQNDVTKQWSFEVDYSSRGPYSPNDIQISEKPGVTAAAQGMTSSAPVATTNPGTASMGSGTTLPKSPGTTTSVNTSGGTVKTTTTGSSGTTKTTTTTTTTGTSGTVKTTTTTTTPGKTTTSTVNNAGIQGVDVSSNNGSVNFASLAAKGVRYAWIKAVEGTYYRNPMFSQQYTSATNAGVIRGAYVFANPQSSNGTQAADYFIANGGGWSNDGRTLPGAIDIEWNPKGSACYGLSPTQMAIWLRSEVTEYRAKEGINPIIYTATAWWNQCVSSSASFSDVPLWLANYSSKPGPLPSGWAGGSQVVWQNSDGNGSGMDTDIFAGSLSDLQRFATVGHL